MGRHQKDGFGYFPLDTNFFYASEKIEALASANGPIGLITCINIFCRVYASGYYYKFTSIESLARSIAKDIMSERDQLKHITSEVTKSLHCMVETGLIDRDLFEMNIISGRSMQEQFADMVRKAKRNTKIDSYNLVGVNVVTPENVISSEEMVVSSEEMGVSSEEGTQSKVNKNITTTTNSLVCTHARCENDEIFPQPVEKSEFSHPSVITAAFYMRDELGLDAVEAWREADVFVAWNDNHGWTCLPDWQAAARLWVARIRCPKG